MMKEILLENNLIDTKEKQEKIINLLITYGITNIEDPFANLSVKDVAKDLHIGKNKAYELFKQPDFPSINIGHSWKIMILPYLIWKLNKRV